MIGVSGMRGTVGGTLTPGVVMRMASAFAVHLKRSGPPKDGEAHRVVLGRDGRPSGYFVRDAAVAALVAHGIAVIDLDIVTTPSVAYMVKKLGADAGVIVTASHNPIQWNGLKFLRSDSIAPPPSEAAAIRKLYDESASEPVRVEALIPPEKNGETHGLHVGRVLELVDTLGISSKRYKVVLDSVNGSGAVPTSMLLSRLGCQVVHLNGIPNGQFTHMPEPIAENLTGLCDEVRRQKAHVGFAQDPDADRLAIVDENGNYIGEEYTLALCAKLVLSKKPGGTAAANLSTSRMLDDIAAQYGGKVVRTPVGEANVVQGMLASSAVIGGEGNGGVIDPRVVPGRDSITSVALVLQLMAATGKTVSQLVAEIPRYEIIKTKFECRREDAERAVAAVVKAFASEKVDLQDGVRIDWANSWVHARASNTEPIMRIIAEAPTRAEAEERVRQVRAVVDGALK
jgi:phosphomannomutase